MGLPAAPAEVAEAVAAEAVVAGVEEEAEVARS
jgi:hypothetical protein